MTITPTVRQLLVAGSPQLAALSVGGVVAYPGVLLHQLRANDTAIPLDLDTASWIGSLHGVAGIPSILMPTVMQWRGRKFAFIAACTLIAIGWILAYTSTSVVTILISESFHGLGTNSIFSVSLLSMGEMVTPKYRNIALLSYSIMQTLGMAIVGIISRFLHWKTISVIMCVPIILALGLAFSWPESPSWLACKGEFQKCEHAFKLLRGNDPQSIDEMKDLIKAQKSLLRSTRRAQTSVVRTLWQTVTSRDFYLPSLHIFVLLNMLYWSGFLVIIIYSIELIEKATLNKNAAFTGGILINSILFACFTITAVLIKRFENKRVLLLSAMGTIISLLCASAVTFMQSVGMLTKDSMACLYFLLAYMVCISLGMSSIAFTIASEIMPVKHRGIGGVLYVIYTCILHTWSLKLSPYLFLYINMWGTFLVYATNTVLCSLFVWKFVPETKQRTLQEIEDFYIHGKFVGRLDNRDSVSIVVQ